MTRPPQNNSNSRQTGKRRRVALFVVASLLIIFSAAIIPLSMGYGWFGHRLVLHGSAELYVLNLSDQPKYVTIDEQTPTEVAAGNARIIPVIGGPMTIRATDDQDQSVGTWETETSRSDLFLNLSDDTCFVVSQLSGLTDDASVNVEIVQRLEADTELHQLQSRNIVWPRGYPGVLDESSSEPPLSVEAVDCWLLNDAAFLTDYLESRFEERLDSAPGPDSTVDDSSAT